MGGPAHDGPALGLLDQTLGLQRFLHPGPAADARHDGLYIGPLRQVYFQRLDPVQYGEQVGVSGGEVIAADIALAGQLLLQRVRAAASREAARSPASRYRTLPPA